MTLQRAIGQPIANLETVREVDLECSLKTAQVTWQLPSCSDEFQKVTKVI
eukprot:CAMPEP_0172657330 /NCGR_PEP_ID=MMETSP1074-20121228/2026_1 /TAXON_ID=2916 /ORGANISM="Ceratium fusus, Strain PA161109" /LENGTH=49 /DNA_ID= /DNA_START= /DNA_END= /DNA_ORIENTATION=